MGGSYLAQILQDYNQNIQTKLSPQLVEFQKNAGLEVNATLWFNRFYNYRLALVPGILAFLVTLVGGMLSALNIVSEKEIGTIEQINVSPIKNLLSSSGNLFLWILANVAFTMGLLVSDLSMDRNLREFTTLYFRSLSFSHFRIRFIDFHL